jgi:Zn-dependent alcohol dehydrogenase
MDTLAALFRDVGAPVSVERIELDPPAPTEILVCIAAVGLCRTDYHVMRGERCVAMRPMVLGSAWLEASLNGLWSIRPRLS